MVRTKHLLDAKVTEVMTSGCVSVLPNTLMDKLIDIFEKNQFHHVPVLDKNKKPVGMISRTDYNKLQHHFTLFEYKEAEVNNARFFRSLIAEDVMNKNPITVGSGTSLKEVLKMFMVNRFHSLIVVENESCVGIVTPFDFLELLLDTEEKD